MTGILSGSDNYLTEMTLGVLEDIGFMVDYDSGYVKNSGENIEISYLEM